MSRYRPRTVLILILAVLAITLAGCTSQDYTPLATMQAMPESHLPPFPGATLLDQQSKPRTQSLLTQELGAQMLRRFGTNADLQAVSDYYQSLLEPLGWSGCCSVWDKDGYLFEIFDENPGALDPSWRGYALVYREVLEQDVSATPTPPTR